MNDDDENGGIFTGPNASAYERTEMRYGPPLEYVAEKLRNAVEELHRWAS